MTQRHSPIFLEIAIMISLSVFSTGGEVIPWRENGGDECSISEIIAPLPYR